MHELLAAMQKKFIAAGVPADVAAQLQFSDPPNAGLGDIALACFPLAKLWGVSPPEAAHRAHEILLGAKNFGADKIFSALTGIADMQEAGPYLNFRLADEWLLDSAMHRRNDSAARRKSRPTKSREDSSDGDASRNQSLIMVEYCQPNTHKEFHIGHMRNACYGSALVNIWRAVGRRIIAATYNNDVGSHVAKTLWALKKFHAGDMPPAAAHEKGRWLAGMYVEATRALEEHPEWKPEVSEVLRALESGEKKMHALWKKTRGWSLAEFRAIYAELGLKFDASFDESAVKARGHKIVDELLARHIARMSDGAAIMDFESAGNGVLIIRKSDGTGNYATSDLALAQEKFRRYKISESVVITDNRQSLYFAQLFATLHAYGFTQKMTHLPYELVTLPSGTMSSRHGTVVLYETLRDEVLAAAAEEIKKRHPEWRPARAQKIAHALAVGAIRWSMLKSSPAKQIVFDKTEALAFDGYTAPYVAYTLARINSIFKKAGRAKVGQSNRAKKIRGQKYPWSHTEHALWVHLAKFENATARAAHHNDPSELTKYCFELAQSFAHYYEHTRILDDDEKIRAARLTLLTAIHVTLQRGLTLLGIPLLTEM